MKDHKQTDFLNFSHGFLNSNSVITTLVPNEERDKQRDGGGGELKRQKMQNDVAMQEGRTYP